MREAWRERREGERDMRGRGFTLIELLVVIAVIATLMGLLLPTLAGARWAARGVSCLSRIRQLGVGLAMYVEDSRGALPQYRVNVAPGVSANIGSLFGGKKGTLGLYGINQIGAERRPLNRYVNGGEGASDASGEAVELEVFRSPGDTGATLPFFGFKASMYDFLGSSYTLNDHALDGESAATLIPQAGGKMPTILAPTLVWVLGSHTIYNHQENGDRGMRWYGRKGPAANLLFADFHASGPVGVPAGVVNTTRDYTFLPTPDWLTGASAALP